MRSIIFASAATLSLGASAFAVTIPQSTLMATPSTANHAYDAVLSFNSNPAVMGLDSGNDD